MSVHLQHNDSSYAYNTINGFFDQYGLGGSRYYIETIVKTAGIESIWKKEAPANVLLFMQDLHLLIAAAFIIYNGHEEIKEAIVQMPQGGFPDMSVSENFIDRYYDSNIWNNFPRYLTVKQYHDPYRAIKRFCISMSQPGWKETLEKFTEYALSYDAISEEHLSYNILSVLKRLLQLVEACHLLNLRTCKKKPL